MNRTFLKIAVHTSLLFFCINASNAQDRHALLYSFNTDSTVLDSNDSSIRYYKDLQVYSTINGLWDGEKRSTQFPVIEGTESWESWVVPIKTDLEDEFIFVLDTNINIVLEKDSVYDLEQLTWRVNCRVRDYQQLMIVEKFDTSLRAFTLDTVDVTDNRNYCFCGTKYNGRITAILQAIQPYDITKDAYLYTRPELKRYLNPRVVMDSIKADFIGNDSVHYVDILWGKYPYRSVVMSNPSKDPYSTDTNFIEIHPFSPVKERVTVSLISYGGLFIQPHTEIVASMFDSATQTRHKLILDLESGSFCLPIFIELVIKDDNELHLNGGNIALKGKRACTMIRDQASLVIGAEQEVKYGQDGIGILGLKPGCKVLFEEQASLTIDNMLLLSDYWETLEGGEIDITLRDGNELSFGPSGWVSNGPFAHGSVRLNIHLKGGTVNLEHLDAKSLELINLIHYDDELSNVPLALYPNPARDLTSLSFTAMLSESVQVQVIDAKGRLMYSAQMDISEGRNTVQLETAQLPKGLYLVKIESTSNTQTARLSTY